VRICVLADDLIWASRLVAAVERAGATSLAASSAAAFERSLAGASAALVDLNGRTYDGVEAIRLAAAASVPVLAVGQHEDVALRRRALAAGARRVFSYNKMFSDGPAVVAGLVEVQR